MAATKIKGLQMWCRRMTDGYAHIDIANFTSSWRDGMAFCALIHRFRPDLIDYDSLSPENVFENCKLAFEIAEQELDIPAFLEAEDMATLKAPDKLSVITYVSQYYNVLSPLPQLGGPGVRSKFSNKIVSGTKRPTDSDSNYAPIAKRTPVKETKENTGPTKEKSLSAHHGDICGICQNRVYLMERHMDGGKLYHRSCFRHSELSPTNKVYTRSPFLSPSLKSETPSFTYPSTINNTSLLSDGEKSGKDLKHRVADEIKMSSVVASIYKKSEGAGSKHQLDDPVKETTKKSKLLSKISLDEEKSKKASAIIDRLQNLKAKYSGNKGSEVGSALPLSGKEARKLERKREEVLGALKPVEEPLKGLKRNVPHILQPNDKQTSGASKSDSVRPASTVATAIKPSLSSLSSSASVKIVTKTTTASKSEDSIAESTTKTSNVSVPTKSNSQGMHIKDKYTSLKNSNAPVEKKLDTTVLKKNILSKSQDAETITFGKSGLDSSERSKTTHPVAKPRTGAPRSVAGGSNENSTPTKPILRASAEQRNKDITPKPIPRKSMFENLEKTPASEHPKITERKKSALGKERDIDELDSTTIASSINPPPLPASAPPPLPASNPVGENNPSLTDRGLIKQSNKLTSEEIKSSLLLEIHEADQKSVSSANISQDLHHEAGPNIVTAHERTKLKHSDKSSTENALVHTLVESQTTDTSEVVVNIKSTSVPFDRQWSSLVSANENTDAHVVPLENESEDTVLTGLLTSSDGDNKSSSPLSSNVALTPILSPHMALSSLVPTFEPLPASYDTNNENSLNSLSESPVNELIPISGPVLKIDSSFKSLNDTAASVSTYEIDKRDINLIQSETLDGESSKIDPPQYGDIISQETSKSEAPPVNIINESNDANYESKYVLNLVVEDITKKSENENNKSDLKQNNLHPTPAKRSVSSDESKTASSIKQNTTSSSKDDLEISGIGLKQVRLKQTDFKKEPVTYNFDANKGSANYESVPQKPPRISKLASQEKREHKIIETDVEKTSDEKLVPSIANIIAEGFTQASPLDPPNKHHTVQVAMETTDEVKELPQWKKDIEERKKKLREDIAKSETVTFKHLREKGLRKASKNSGVVAQTENISTNQDKLAESESINDNEIKKRDNSKDLSSSEQSYSISNLQEESGNRLPPTAGIDNDQEENLKDTNKECLSQTSKKTREHIRQSYNGKNNTDTQNKVTDDSLMKNKTGRWKDSELELVVSKTKLKSLEVDIDISSAEECPRANTDQNHDQRVENVRDEDNKDVLKHISRAVDESIDQVKASNRTDFNSDVSILTKSITNNNEYSNNTSAGSEPNKLSDNEHIHIMDIKGPAMLKTVDCDSEESKVNEIENGGKQNSSESVHVKSDHTAEKECFHKVDLKGGALLETIDLNAEDFSKSNGREDEGGRRISVLSEGKLVLQTKNKDSDGDKDKHTSPKMKRKITVLGRNSKGVPKSPPSSPLPMKKIEVTAKFNFEESSSDFESSLTQSTAKLTIHDKNTPPPRPPPPRLHHNTVPPPQMSAIELQQQLLDLDSQLTDLELRGRDLEESIRNENTLEKEDDELINDWFRMVCERNELVRKESDLVYISKQQDLEDEQEHLESQLRYLMSKPYDCKSVEEKQEEEYLIKRKLELVEKRNKIVDSMDEDRIRYETEDRDIKMMRDSGLWRHSTGALSVVKEKRVSKSVFYS